jgi:hypothetical protein
VIKKVAMTAFVVIYDDIKTLVGVTIRACKWTRIIRDGSGMVDGVRIRIRVIYCII